MEVESAMRKLRENVIENRVKKGEGERKREKVERKNLE